MTVTIEAIYESGVLKHTGPLQDPIAHASYGDAIETGFPERRSQTMTHHSTLITHRFLTVLFPDGKSDSNRFCKGRRPRRRRCSLRDRNHQNLGRGTRCTEEACNRERVSA